MSFQRFKGDNSSFSTWAAATKRLSAVISNSSGEKSDIRMQSLIQARLNYKHKWKMLTTRSVTFAAKRHQRKSENIPPEVGTAVSLNSHFQSKSLSTNQEFWRDRILWAHDAVSQSDVRLSNDTEQPYINDLSTCWWRHGSQKPIGEGQRHLVLCVRVRARLCVCACALPSHLFVLVIPLQFQLFCSTFLHWLPGDRGWRGRRLLGCMKTASPCSRTLFSDIDRLTVGTDQVCAHLKWPGFTSAPYGCGSHFSIQSYFDDDHFFLQMLKSRIEDDWKQLESWPIGTVTINGVIKHLVTCIAMYWQSMNIHQLWTSILQASVSPSWTHNCAFALTTDAKSTECVGRGQWASRAQGHPSSGGVLPYR